MITLINPELFNLTTKKETDKKGNEYFKTTISSSEKVLNKKTNEMINRTITSIQSETEDYNGENMNIKVSKGANGKARVGIQANSTNKYDVHAFLVAIPFNGFIGEIEKSFQYRVYKGLILRTDKKTIEHNGETYKKIAYLLVVPNETLLDEKHKYHTDELKMVVDTFNLETDKDKTNHTIKTTTEITFLNDGVCNYEMYKEEVEPIDSEEFKNKTIFPIYVPNTTNKTNHNSYNKKPSYQKTDYKKSNDIDKMIDAFNRTSNEKQKDFARRNNNKKKRR